MAKLTEQVGYIRGLIGSMQLEEGSPKARLLAALAETKTPIAVVLTCGCAVDVRWRDLCSALLYDPLCGQAERNIF